MKYPPLAFSPVNLCKINVFTSNIHNGFAHKISQTVKIKVNRYTDIYFLMNLFKINQFLFICSCISALLSFLKSICIFVVVDSLLNFMVQSHYIYSENINFTPIHRVESMW